MDRRFLTESADNLSFAGYRQDTPNGVPLPASFVLA